MATGLNITVPLLFQSSIAPKDDRNLSAYAICMELQKCSNPRSPRRTTATIKNRRGREVALFQSSIAPKDDRNLARNRLLRLLSLLGSNPRSPRRTTATAYREWTCGVFSCSNPRSPRRTTATIWTYVIAELLRLCSNPRSPRRTTATGMALLAAVLVAVFTFQSSIAPKDDRNDSVGGGSLKIQEFQSSIAPKDDRNSW